MPAEGRGSEYTQDIEGDCRNRSESQHIPEAAKQEGGANYIKDSRSFKNSKLIVSLLETPTFTAVT